MPEVDAKPGESGCVVEAVVGLGHCAGGERERGETQKGRRQRREPELEYVKDRHPPIDLKREGSCPRAMKKSVQFAPFAATM